MTRDYELGLILNPEVSEEETRAILSRVEQVVASYGGQIVKINQWGRRRLAYPIEHNRDGLYIFIDMILTPETVSELERTLKVSEIVLRHMVKRRDPKAIQKEREEREARAAAAAASQAAAPGASEEQPAEGTAEEQPAEGSAEIPAPVPADAGDTAAPADAPAVSDEEMGDVPPAVEETIEA